MQKNLAALLNSQPPKVRAQIRAGKVVIIDGAGGVYIDPDIDALTQHAHTHGLELTTLKGEGPNNTAKDA